MKKPIKPNKPKEPTFPQKVFQTNYSMRQSINDTLDSLIAAVHKSGTVPIVWADRKYTPLGIVDYKDVNIQYDNWDECLQMVWTQPMQVELTDATYKKELASYNKKLEKYKEKLIIYETKLKDYRESLKSYLKEQEEQKSSRERKLLQQLSKKYANGTH